jgi:glycosyltransferase involved in cell wall biosynthesis
MTAESTKNVLWDVALNRHQDYDFVIRYSKKYTWTVKPNATVIHSVVEIKNLDFNACIKFIKAYKNEISSQILAHYYRGMLQLADKCKASHEITDFYTSEIERLYVSRPHQECPANSEIKVIMIAGDDETNSVATLESILRQSYKEFELIILNQDFTDYTLTLIRTFHDKRIIHWPRTGDHVESLNNCLQSTTAKYLTIIRTGIIPDCNLLAVQHAIMEEEPEITVCGTWATPFGESILVGGIISDVNGLIDNPVIELLKRDFLRCSCGLIRKSFLDEHHLHYQRYMYAEDYKLWAEIAKAGGVFYVESQPLLNYRISENQVSNTKRKEQIASSNRIKGEILDYLVNTSAENQLVSNLLKAMYPLKDKELFSIDVVYDFFYSMFAGNVKKLFDKAG